MHLRISLLARWTLATALGAVAGRAIAGTLPEAGFAAHLAMQGLWLGTLQWLVLRRELAACSRWILLTTIGWMLGWSVDPTVCGLIGSVLYHLDIGPASGEGLDIFQGLPRGAVLGLAQGLGFMRHVGLGWWLLASAIAGGAASHLLPIAPAHDSIDVALRGLLQGSVTGLVLSLSPLGSADSRTHAAMHGRLPGIGAARKHIGRS